MLNSAELRAWLHEHSPPRNQPARVLSGLGMLFEDLQHDSLAEELLRTQGAPVAIVGGSRVTMPYGMAIFSTGLFQEFFVHRRETLGEVLLHAKRSMAGDGRGNVYRAMLDAVGKTFSPSGSDLASERMEHLDLLNLIGDPLLRIRYPQQLQIKSQDRAVAGDQLTIEGTCSVDGVCP